MKNNYNTLHPYILDNSRNEYYKETVNGLFRSILEPVTANQKFESCILFRLFDISDKQSLIKRLAFSKAEIYSFSDSLDSFGFKNIEKDNIWKGTEFILVIGSRYSACLMWDYSLSDKADYTPVCLLYNSNIITEIAKKIAANSSVDLREILFKNLPDRRENRLLNTAINSIASMLNSKNEEIIFSELEKEHILKSDDNMQTAAIVADKAKFIAHEIKNNLSIINLYSKIMQKRLESVKADEETNCSLGGALLNITKASENISAHINDLRCLSSVYKSEFDIVQSIYSVISQCEQKAKQSGVEIQSEEINSINVVADKIKFECSLLNVIYNAIEACTNGCYVKIYCKKEDKEVKVLIKNNGTKIPENIKQKIFEPDFTTKEKGNGLGLAICKKQLELSGGNINLLYSNDEETLFEITLIV